MARISVTPELLARFAAYENANPSWGCMHVVLEDGNFNDGNVDGAIQCAEEEGDIEGRALALLLRQMSRTQRRRIAREAH
jgi:hypothetical protein